MEAVPPQQFLQKGAVTKLTGNSYLQAFHGLFLLSLSTVTDIVR